MYSSITPAMPDTIAEKMNTTGINGDDHHGFALIEPKINPTYPCNRNADGMPIKVTIHPTRSSSLISNTSTAIRYHRYTYPNIAIADELCGVKYISGERSGCPRCSCSGSGATSRNASAVSSASRYVGFTASTRKTRSSD